jgi:hypothetical protein
MRVKVDARQTIALTELVDFLGAVESVSRQSTHAEGSCHTINAMVITDIYRK